MNVHNGGKRGRSLSDERFFNSSRRCVRERGYGKRYIPHRCRSQRRGNTRGASVYRREEREGAPILVLVLVFFLEEKSFVRTCGGGTEKPSRGLRRAEAPGGGRSCRRPEGWRRRGTKRGCPSGCTERLLSWRRVSGSSVVWGWRQGFSKKSFGTVFFFVVRGWIWGVVRSCVCVCAHRCAAAEGVGHRAGSHSLF